MKRIVLLAFLYCQCTALLAQGDVKLIVQNGKFIQTGTSDALSRISVSVPNRMQIYFLDDDYSQTVISFIDSSLTPNETFRIVFKDNRDEEPASATRTLYISPTLLAKKTLNLTFSEGKLIGIGTNILDTFINVSKSKKLTIMLADTLTRASKPGPRPDKPAQQAAKKEKTICNTKVDLKDALDLPPDIKQQFNFLCEKSIVDTAQSTSTKGCCKNAIPPIFDFMVEKPCYDSKGNAVSISDMLIIDKNIPLKEALFSFKDLGQHEGPVVNKKMRVKANRMMLIGLVTDTVGDYTIDTAGHDSFMEFESQFAKNIIPATPTQEEGKKDTTMGGRFNAAGQKSGTDNKKIDTIDINKTVSLRLDLVALTTSYQLGVTADYLRYQAALKCIQINIVGFFQTNGIPANGDELKKMISNKLIADSVDVRYYPALCTELGKIGITYDLALQKATQKKFFYSKMVIVPNADQFTITVKKDNKNVLFSNDFEVYGGFKIDFSTGLFLTGLSHSTFVASSEQFHYKASRDSVDASGAIHTIYDGQVKDTMMTVLHKNKNLNIGAGLMAHFYPRLGGAVDIGGVVGVLFDAQTQMQVLVGASCMFKTKGAHRISFVGGLALGKEQVLSAESKQYYWDGKDRYFNTRQALPANYTNSGSPSTVSKMHASWFLGITFNFATLNTNK